MNDGATQNATAPAVTTRSPGRARWFRFIVLVMAGGTIYKLANMKDVFYVPMQDSMGLTNTEIGLLLSVNSIVATALFVVGGILADKISSRLLIPAGLIGAGAMGVFISTMPGYSPLLFAFAALAICSDCLLWPALLKSVRHLAGSDEQGRMFGFLEAGRGVVDTLVAFGALGVFALLGSGTGGFRAAILFYALVDIVIGILVFLLLRDQPKDGSQPVKAAPTGLRTILGVARMPQLWWVSVTVFMVYIVYCGLTYFTPYLANVYGLPTALVGAYGIINQYGLKILGGPAGGFLADKVFKSASRYLRWAFLGLIPIAAVILLLPTSPGSRVPAMIALLLFALIIFSMRGVFWAPMEEVGIPEEITGTAFGIASLVGYAPGMFAFIIYGAILDNNPGASGYRIVFVIMALLALVGAGVATMLTRIVRRRRAALQLVT